MMQATVKHNDALESLRVHELNDLIRANFITVYTEENGEINLKITEDSKMAIKEYYVNRTHILSECLNLVQDFKSIKRGIYLRRYLNLEHTFCPKSQ